MRYHALACDYDGTLATHGRVHADTTAALQKLKRSGRKLILVTGRILSDLADVFPEHDLFDAIVAENGALLAYPARHEHQRLAEAPPEQFVQALRRQQVSPLTTGEVIVATTQPHEAIVLKTIRDLGLELHVIFNKGAVMVLPSSVNKATGLRSALDVFGLSPHDVVGIGDAENDQAFLRLCECGVAVANALPSVKEQADWVTARDHGAGVIELITHLLDDDLAALAARLSDRLRAGERSLRALTPPAGPVPGSGGRCPSD